MMRDKPYGGAKKVREKSDLPESPGSVVITLSLHHGEGKFVADVHGGCAGSPEVDVVALPSELGKSNQSI